MKRPQGCEPERMPVVARPANPSGCQAAHVAWTAHGSIKAFSKHKCFDATTFFVPLIRLLQRKSQRHIRMSRMSARRNACTGLASYIDLSPLSTYGPDFKPICQVQLALPPAYVVCKAITEKNWLLRAQAWPSSACLHLRACARRSSALSCMCQRSVAKCTRALRDKYI